VNFKKYPKDLLIKLKKQSDEITQNLARQDTIGTQILDNILKHREIFMFWSNYSEKSFLESRL
jgi:TRAP-type mannitol/chloroaromatic compound transport system substrate-binding protein